MAKVAYGKFWWLITLLAALSGLLYNSWPLGYWLNPIVAKSGLASGLEALHQPYNWVFMAGDIMSSLIIMLVCWWLWRRPLPASSRHQGLLDAVLINVIIFGLGTIADTLLPMHCEPSLRHCPSFTVDYFLLFHGIFSILAALCLFLSLFLLWWAAKRNYLLSIVLFGYVLFSFFSLFEILGFKGGNWSQHYYLTLCGLWLALLPYAVYSVLVTGTPRKESA